MEIRFLKLAVAANDLILCDLSGVERKPGSLNRLAKRLCSARKGAGGNGILFLLAARPAVEAAFFLPSGAEGPVENDALLCLARYVFDSAMVGAEGFALRTGFGERRVDTIDSRSFRLSLGKPLFPGEDKPFLLPVGQRYVSISPLSLQRDAFVLLFNPDFPVRYEEFTAALRASAAGKAKLLPVLAKTVSKAALRARCPLSSGRDKPPLDLASAAAIAAVAAIRLGLCDRAVAVRLGGGDFIVEWASKDAPVLVTAQPEYLYQGSYFYREEREEGD